ncbi:Putative spermidine/putrescine transport system substrate-binding protein [Hyphomicrobiales bacterium]|nr:putative spermidine/putrescine transport system substrate-binding protein [Hyphomicrobiales bacterium]CAH1676837.1 Putative spermidine/putrescine transport system substrate-binding protein [Hyphomicrobiales bacterium]
MTDKTHSDGMTRRSTYSRRSVIGGIAVGAAAIAAPNVIRAQSGGRVLVRTSGGSYQDALQAGTWNSFTQKTGIEVVGVAANTGKLLAMVEAGSRELDIVEGNAVAILTLQAKGALQPLDVSRFEYTDPKDIGTVGPDFLSYASFAEALVYNTEAFPKAHPTDWKQFWDVNSFPGKRMLQDAKAIAPNLEFALLADGVPVEQLYPLDIDRAFAKLRQIKPHVVKFFDSGALGASLLAEKTAVLGSLWTNRVEALRKGGAPLAVEWNQAMRLTEYTAVLKNAPNRDAALRLLDYSSSPEAQARTLPQIGLSPENKRAFEFIAQDVAETLPTFPAIAKKGFEQNADWWLKNRAQVATRWEEFLLG